VSARHKYEECGAEDNRKRDEAEANTAGPPLAFTEALLRMTALQTANTARASARNSQTEFLAVCQRSSVPHSRSFQPNTKKGRIPIARESENVLSILER
jgi:hypothetical protein